eukprot:COSAG02_NODE_11504_length_1710_cov_34.225947_1_plen_76_part_00
MTYTITSNRATLMTCCYAMQVHHTHTLHRCSATPMLSHTPAAAALNPHSQKMTATTALKIIASKSSNILVYTEYS